LPDHRVMDHGRRKGIGAYGVGVDISRFNSTRVGLGNDVSRYIEAQFRGQSRRRAGNRIVKPLRNGRRIAPERETTPIRTGVLDYARLVLGS
jgi:hypothetical protein